MAMVVDRIPDPNDSHATLIYVREKALGEAWLKAYELARPAMERPSMPGIEADAKALEQAAEAFRAIHEELRGAGVDSDHPLATSAAPIAEAMLDLAGRIRVWEDVPVDEAFRRVGEARERLNALILPVLEWRP
jgi:hypothetical protein